MSAARAVSVGDRTAHLENAVAAERAARIAAESEVAEARSAAAGEHAARIAAESVAEGEHAARIAAESVAAGERAARIAAESAAAEERAQRIAAAAAAEAERAAERAAREAAEGAAAAEQLARAAAEQRAASPEWGKRVVSEAFLAAEAWRRDETAKLYANMTDEDWETAARWKRFAEPDAPERTCAQPLPPQLLGDILGLSAALARQPPHALTNASCTQYLARLAFHSTGLEGNTLTLQETVLTVQGAPLHAGLHPRVHGTPASAASFEEAGNSALLWQGLGLGGLPRAGPHPVSLALLNLTGLADMNSAITRGTGTPTGLRRRHVALGHKRTMLPMPDELPVLMREFMAWLRGSGEAAADAAAAASPLEATLALACNAHTRFVFIHPFADGNGRLARTLSALVLQRGGLPAPMIPRQRRSAYMAAVSSATMARDYAPLALMHAQAVHRSLSCLVELVWGEGGGAVPEQVELAMAARGGGCGDGSET